MVSKDCIYLTGNQYQIWLDFGENGELRDFYLYENGLLKFKSSFCFMRQNLCVRNTMDDLTIWNCEKGDDKFSIRINNDLYYIDQNNDKLVILFDELIDHIFK